MSENWIGAVKKWVKEKNIYIESTEEHLRVRIIHFYIHSFVHQTGILAVGLNTTYSHTYIHTPLVLSHKQGVSLATTRTTPLWHTWQFLVGNTLYSVVHLFVLAPRSSIVRVHNFTKTSMDHTSFIPTVYIIFHMSYLYLCVSYFIWQYMALQFVYIHSGGFGALQRS